MARLTIKDIAEVCGLAPSTVSRALNDRPDVSQETKDRVRAVAERLGYVAAGVARGADTARNTVGLVIQGETSELLIRLFAELEQQLDVVGYDAYLAHVPDHMATVGTVQRMLAERNFVGLIFLGLYGSVSAGGPATASTDLASLGVPIVYCATADPSSGPDSQSSVSVDDFGGARELTRMLIARGHRRIAFASVGDRRGRESAHGWALRYRGYRTAMAEAGIGVDDSLLIPALNPPDMYSMACGYQSVRQRVHEGLGGTTAIVCSCDAVATGALRALHEAGLNVPGDISVTGFDGLDVARYTVPSLTTMRQPLPEIAKVTVRVLLDSLHQKNPGTEQVWIPTSVMVGESVGDPATDRGH